MTAPERPLMGFLPKLPNIFLSLISVLLTSRRPYAFDGVLFLGQVFFATVGANGSISSVLSQVLHLNPAFPPVHLPDIGSTLSLLRPGD